ncbi:segregation/condensation protein A [Candidatus Woesearchaeota archaeon]|nr:segregation/condensation protein A [Candidatus Woesearchaeota archaeon]
MTQEKIMNTILKEEEISWKQIILDIINNEGMDPWDIDVSSIAKEFLDTVRKMKELDLKLSGKVILAAAILLKIKSKKFLGEDILEFDKLFAPDEEDTDDEDIPDLIEERIIERPEDFRLIPRTPQPRKRKVSVYDLVNALEKALEVKNRRVLRDIEIELEIPEKKADISKLIEEILQKIMLLCRQKEDKLTFTELVQSDKKEDKIYTFIPMLHLTNARKIDLEQKEHFGEIEITLNMEKI